MLQYASRILKTTDIYLCPGISLQQSCSFFYVPRPKVQPMAKELDASLILWQFNKINHQITSGPCVRSLQRPHS